MKSITRRLARTCTLQALYSWHLSRNDVTIITEHIIISQNIQNFNVSYFFELYTGIINCISELENLMLPYVPSNFKRISCIEYSVLLIALFELTKRYDIPYKVVINEAIELTKIFGAEQSYKFVNSVLDKIVAQLLLCN